MAASERVTQAKPGPWGQIEYVSINLSCPEEMLPVGGFERRVTRWHLPGFTPEKYLQWLDELEITGDLREEFRSPAVLQILPTGIELIPSKKIIFETPRETRDALYARLAAYSENWVDLVFVLKRTMETRFRHAQVTPRTIELLKRVSADYGRYLLFSDVARVLAEIPDYRERVRFIKALTAQESLVARLHVPADADVDRLAAYWRNESGPSGLRALFESLTRVPGGASVDLATLLPPAAAARLYSFPSESDASRKPGISHDCHWTAFNFFNETAQDRFGNPDGVADGLEQDYMRITADPRYGDLALFFTPDGLLVHSSVYLADEIVYSKNGDTPMHPWMLSTISKLHDQYSFQIPPGQSLEVRYYRSKKR